MSLSALLRMDPAVGRDLAGFGSCAETPAGTKKASNWLRSGPELDPPGTALVHATPTQLDHVGRGNRSGPYVQKCTYGICAGMPAWCHQRHGCTNSQVLVAVIASGYTGRVPRGWPRRSAAPGRCPGGEPGDPICRLILHSRQ